MKIEIKRHRIAVGAMLLLFCGAILLLVTGSIKMLVVTAVFIAALSVLQFDFGPKGNPLLLTAYFLFMAFATVVLVQLILNESIFDIAGSRLLLNFAICLFLYLFFFTFIPNYKTAVLLTSFLLLLFSTVNFYVFLFRGSEMAPADFLSLDTARNVVSSYKFTFPNPMIYSWVLYAILV